MQGISCLAKQLFATQERLCSMELVSNLLNNADITERKR
jgi:hypothetical protein